MSAPGEARQRRAPAIGARGRPILGLSTSKAAGGFLSYAQFDLLDMLVHEGPMSCQEINDRAVPAITYESSQRRLRIYRTKGLIEAEAQERNRSANNWTPPVGGEAAKGILIYSATDLGREKFAATLAVIDAKLEHDDEEGSEEGPGSEGAHRSAGADAAQRAADEWDAQERAFG